MEKLYWDTCIIYDYLRKRPHYYDKFIEPMIKMAERGNLLIVTSVISQVECQYCQWIENNPTSYSMIDAFFQAPWVELRPCDQRVSHLSQTMLRENRGKLRNFDAIQLATAVLDRLHMITHDGDGEANDKPLLAFDERYGDPHIKVMTPQQYFNLIGTAELQSEIPLEEDEINEQDENAPS